MNLLSLRQSLTTLQSTWLKSNNYCFKQLALQLPLQPFANTCIRLGSWKWELNREVQFITDISVYDPNMLIFVDESGSDKRSAFWRYGYALNGKPAVADKLLIRGKRYLAISMMSVDGLLDAYVTDGSVDGEKFCTFIERCLLPQLQPFNGRNTKCCDNGQCVHSSCRKCSPNDWRDWCPSSFPPSLFSRFESDWGSFF